MPYNTITAYDLQDLEKPLIPPRSRLYHLEPIGIGTSYVESLTSYFVRLANAHCLQPKRLACLAVLPLVKDLDQLPLRADKINSWLKGFNTINGATTFTTRWVDALEQLTLRSDLRFLTMLTWRNVIHRRGFARKAKVWCSKCYCEWRETGQIIYEPLIWCLKDVVDCPRHLQSLSQQCPNRDCQRAVPLLADWSQPGFCPHCQCFLGSELVVESCETRVGESNAEWSHWVNNQVSELLTVAPNLSTFPSMDDVALKISLRLRTEMKQDNSILAEKLRISASNLVGWQQGLHTIHFSLLLKLCYHLLISPAQLLMSIEDSKKYENRDLFEEVNSHVDIGALRESLRALLEGSANPTSLKTVARQLGYPPGFLHYHYPDLCSAITKKYASRQKITRLVERDLLRRELEHLLSSDGDVLPPLNEIAGRLNCSPSFLHRHFPHLCKEISERRRLSKKNANGRQTVAGPTKEDLAFGATKGSNIRQQQNLLNGAGQKEKLDLSLVMSEVQPLSLHRLASRSRPSKSDIDRMERILRAILARDQSPPAIKEIAKNMGHSPVTIRKYFPDLYHQILNRRSVALDIDHLRKSLDFVLSEREPLPTLVDIARKLGCSVRSLRHYFPTECKEVIARRNKTDVEHEDPDNLTRQQRALDEALLSAEPLPLKTIAKSLGCYCRVLRRRFPALCQSIEERYEKSIDAGRIRKALEEALAHDNPPLSVSKIAKSLGYPDKVLERYCPELCSAILERRLLRPDISNLKVNLEAILASAEDPISMSEVERRLGYPSETIFNRFPELYSAISHKYQIFRRQRKQERVERLCQAVQQAIIAIHNQGERPTSPRVGSMIGGTVHFKIPEVRDAWRRKMKELGYEI